MLARRSRFVRWFRLILSVCTLAATAFLAAAGDLKPVPSDVLLFGVAAFLVLVGAVLPAFDESRFERKLVAEWYMMAHLRAAFNFMVESHQFAPLDLRLHFFLVQWRWQRSWRLLQRRLVRAAFFSIKTSWGLSSIEWPKGAGLVGQVWAAGDINGRAANVQVAVPQSAAEWEKIPAEDRWNMTWEQAQRVGRTQTVFAIAARSKFLHGNVVGVLSADTSANELAKFNDPAVKAFLRQAALAAWQSRRQK